MSKLLFGSVVHTHTHIHPDMHVVIVLQVTEEQHLRNLSSSMNSLQQTLEEASRLLKLVWRVSLPAGGATAGESGANQQVGGKLRCVFLPASTESTVLKRKE